ncbi:MAG: hypothetical protein O7E51_11155 [Acidobacteria bacterium]|nr:hypothetical protein [Acidobacteriota bacterium]
MAKRISWWQAAEIIGINDRQMRRWWPSGGSETKTASDGRNVAERG